MIKISSEFYCQIKTNRLRVEVIYRHREKIAAGHRLVVQRSAKSL